MLKEHDMWLTKKKLIDADEGFVNFHEREIWWCATGVNIGSEQDGKGKKFLRPALILKGFNKSVCWILPLTTSPKEKPYQLHIMFLNKPHQIILSQVRLIDQKRLEQKMGMLSVFQFNEIKKAFREI
jgi:mRNA interferase MazF